MSKNLVIVESPHKAKTIGKYLGKDYNVLASQGHIRDIEPLGKNSMGIDFEHNYKPNYVIDPTKQRIVEALKAEVAKADTVWLASDLDREGEAIAWHLKEVLDLDKKDTKRIVFPDVTETSILEAIRHPRNIDYNLVNAQQARRVLDRIVGFELSPVLWKKVTTGLSAGRVQSVVVRLVVEREREIESFQTTSQYRVLATFVSPNNSDAVLHAELNHRFATKEEAEAFLEQCANADFYISDIQKKPSKRKPAPPFETSSLQQEAVRKLKFPPSKTMRLAQSLYEAGHITYMRTDSLNLSDLALATTKKEILAEYGDRYAHTRKYHTAAKGAQEAHEAIRPTYMSKHSAGENADEKRLYELIWKRTIACQMEDAEVETTRIEVKAAGVSYTFAAIGKVVTFDGFMRAYVQSDDDPEEDEPMLPQMSVNEALVNTETTAQQSFSQPPHRYNEASLIDKMKELGIGRPSTYAATVDLIQSRKYVERGSVQGQKRSCTILTLKNGKITEKQKQETFGAEQQRLIPTDLGQITNDFLVKQFPELLSYDFTAHEEENFDLIAKGQADWVQTVDTFYKAFHPQILSIPAGKVAGRELGNDPTTGEPVIAKISKMGPCIQIGANNSEKPRFASLKKGQSIFTITLPEALELFNQTMPYTLGQIEGEDVVVGEGKYGPYLRYQGGFVSIPRTIDPMQITLEEAKDLIEKKNQKQEPIHVYGDIQVLNGRYGAYIKAPSGNYKIPQGTEAAQLTEADCQQIIASTAPSAQKRTFRRKSTK